MSIPTTHGAVAVKDTGGSAPAVVFIHGNSSAKEIFAAQLDSPLRELYRLLALDLPDRRGRRRAVPERVVL